MTTKVIFLLLISSISFKAYSQVSGRVFEKSKNDKGKSKEEGVPGVGIYWLHYDAKAISDKDGAFSIEAPAKLPDTLIFKYVGYPNDTLEITKAPLAGVKLVYEEGTALSGLTVKAKQSVISLVDPKQIRIISQKHLHSAACCNLSESFERDATVDVSYSDGVSGTKKIKMLGLDGAYTQMLFENIPTMRGLSAPYGLTFIPGPWLQSLYVTKGTGSVVNGYESITGQINMEFVKPDDAEKLFVNGYINRNQRYELNGYSAKKLNSKWSTMFFANGNMLQNRVDRNDDSFIDDPLTKQISVFNRWKWQDENKMVQFGVKGLIDDRSGGQTTFDYGNDYGTTNSYGFGSVSTQVEAFAKGGMPLSKEGHAMAFMSSYRYHNQDAYYGLRNYDGTQNSAYLNLIYSGIFGNTNHAFATGLSTTYDDYSESFADSSYARTEYVPGAFFEYTLKNAYTFTGVFGIRGDYHSIFGFQYSPRVHLKYTPTENAYIRLAGGKGFRSPNAIMENASIFASSRILNVDLDSDYQIEEAWNYGVSFTQEFQFLKHDATLIIDFFRTDFANQIVIDMETAGQVNLYSLSGPSYSNAFQFDLLTEPLTGFEVSVAYKYTDAAMTYNEGLRALPYVPKHRALLNLDYTTRNKKWSFSVTNNYFGVQRVPYTNNSSVENQRSGQSDDYYMLHAQITKKFKYFDLYLGGENLTGYIQKNAIISPRSPFDSEFDASMIWGPLNSQIVYLGFRYRLK